ncbi:PaaI family thioesterase [Aneurinibacillus sp. Ricciae_BoGa-3]|uniref:PaaI family thioesterase n=1 Tax=Aneurinibacillus sp. Ricciae_BoGa-3 TaxID=3022697 RepID=UPI002341A95F|nr:PaaI family thioesterase [Aneurinibacillus sp. Ricciae_BoGa-3]WCK56356.1 PaaI family thioesterase [Aneurinibacillus sp. Ricciae_BoGa-3]
MMDQILHDLKTLSPEQLNEIQRVIQAYKGSLENSQIGVGNLHYEMNFLKRGKGDKLFAKTHFLHWGRTTIVAQCTIEDQEGDAVAHALGTFYVKTL